MSKRGSGEGSIYQRADGRWCASISVGYAGGKRKRKSIYGSTRHEVSLKLTRALAGEQQGVSAATNERLTVGQWLKQWLALPSKRRPSTLDVYRRVIRLHLEPALGRVKLRKLSVQDIQDYKHLKASRMSPARLQVQLFCLSAAVQEALRQDLVVRNVVRLAGGVQVPRRPAGFLAPDEARAFLRAAEGHIYEPLLIVALALGTRIGETRGLRWSDINFSHNYVTVNRQIAMHEGIGSVVTDVKTVSGRRTIHLPTIAIEALLKQKRLQGTQREGATSWADDDYIFTSRVGTPVGVAPIRLALKTILAAAGLRPRRFHDLRHSCGSLLLAQGIPLKVISEMLGHSSISVTANVYLSVIPELQREAALQMDAVLAPR